MKIVHGAPQNLMPPPQGSRIDQRPRRERLVEFDAVGQRSSSARRRKRRNHHHAGRCSQTCRIVGRERLAPAERILAGHEMDDGFHVARGAYRRDPTGPRYPADSLLAAAQQRLEYPSLVSHSTDSEPVPDGGSTSSMLQRSSGIAVASATSQGLVAVATLLAARVCDPSFFGILGVFTTLVVIGGTLASLRLEAAVVLPRSDQDARRLAMLGMLVSPLPAAAGWIAMSIGGGAILPRFDAEGLLAVTWAVPIGILVHGWRAIMLGWCTRQGHVRAVAFGRLANGIAMASGLGLAALLSPSLVALVSAWIAGQSAELLILGGRAIRDPGFRTGSGRPYRGRRLWRRYRRFPLVQMWSYLIEQLGPHLPIALIAASFSAEVAGVYSIISRIVARPMAVIGSSIAVVFQHDVSLARRQRQPLRPVLAGGLRRLGLAAAIIFLPVAAIGPWMLPRLLGPDWVDPGLALLAVLPGVVADFIAVPVLPLLGIMERVGTQLVGGVARLVLVAGAIAGLAMASLSPIAMMSTVAVLIVSVDLVMLSLTWHATRNMNVPSSQESP